MDPDGPSSGVLRPGDIVLAVNRKPVANATDAMKAGQGLNDPSGADSLYKYIQSNPHIHLQTHAALALAAIGDIRAVPTLAKRLRMAS